MQGLQAPGTAERAWVPNPRGAGWGAGMLSYVLFWVGLIALEIALLSRFTDPPVAVHLGVVAVAGLGAWSLHRLLAPRGFWLRAQGGRVLGLGGRRVPVGGGTVTVREHPVHELGMRYAVKLERPPDPHAVIDADLTDPVLVRAYVEGICRVGRHRMRWVTSGVAEEEIREPEDLDRPLVERLRPGETPFGTRRTPKAPSLLWEVDRDGSLLYRWKGTTLPELVLQLVLFTPPVGLLFSAYGFRSGDWRLALYVGAAGAAACVFVLTVIFLISLCVRDELRISRSGVELRRTLLGVLPSRQRLRSDELESVYVDRREGLPCLLLAGNSRHLRVGPFSTVEAARQAADMLVRALRGEKVQPD